MANDWDEYGWRPFAETVAPDAALRAFMRQQDGIDTEGRTTTISARGQAPAPAQAARPSRPLRVAIELGHGGRDPGASRNGVLEAQVIRSVAPWLSQLSGGGIAYEFWERPASAGVDAPLTVLGNEFRRNPPDIVISLHANVAASSKGDSPEPYGARIIYYPGHATSENLAKLMQREVTPWERGLGSSGAMPALVTWPYRRDGKDYHYPLWETGRHAMVQVEMGFLTNPADWMRMQGRGFAKQSAAQIDRAVRAFAKQNRLLPPLADSRGTWPAMPGSGSATTAPRAPESDLLERWAGPDPSEPTPPMPVIHIASPRRR